MAYIANLGERTYNVEIEEVGEYLYRVVIDGNEVLVDGRKTGRTNYSLIIDKQSFEVDVDIAEDEYRVLADGRTYHVRLVDERKTRLGGLQSGVEPRGRQEIAVPMPGKIVAVLVTQGDRVEKGQGLVIVEAMKMENEVRSTISGEVKEIRIKAGETVEAGKVLLVVE
jgi:biotin carboxyl carrier protein